MIDDHITFAEIPGDYRLPHSLFSPNQITTSDCGDLLTKVPMYCDCPPETMAERFCCSAAGAFLPADHIALIVDGLLLDEKLRPRARRAGMATIRFALSASLEIMINDRNVAPLNLTVIGQFDC